MNHHRSALATILWRGACGSGVHNRRVGYGVVRLRRQYIGSMPADSTNCNNINVRQLKVTRHTNEDLQGVVGVQLQNPKANVLGLALVSELEEAIQQLSEDTTVRAVVISSGVPGIFSAGADLKERARMTHDEAELFVERLRSLMSAVAGIPAPTIAAADGAAYGGGLELMLACDLRVAGAGAIMGLTETSLGIIPGAGGTQRLPRLIGASAAKELIFTARTVSAERALELGMVGTVVAAGMAEKEALLMAGNIARRGPVAVRAAKKAIDRGLQLSASEGMAFEREMYARVLGTKDRDEGLLAFKEKRPPSFTGK